METQSNHWLPLTEYALRSGMSISTLRRKIKSNTIAYRMEEGRYLIRGDELSEASRATGFASSDAPQDTPKVPISRPATSSAAPEVTTPKTVTTTPTTAAAIPATFTSAPGGDVEALREEIRRMQDDNLLRWKALEARVSGIAKKLEFFSEQIAEAKMLVKIFEEKLDHRA